MLWKNVKSQNLFGRANCISIKHDNRDWQKNSPMLHLLSAPRRSRTPGCENINQLFLSFSYFSENEGMPMQNTTCPVGGRVLFFWLAWKWFLWKDLGVFLKELWKKQFKSPTTFSRFESHGSHITSSWAYLACWVTSRSWALTEASSLLKNTGMIYSLKINVNLKLLQR